MHRLGHLRRRRLGGMGVPVGHGFLDPRQHRPPAGDGSADIGQRIVDLALQRLAQHDIGKRIDLDVKEALEPAPRCRHVEHPIGRRIELQHRGADEADHPAARPDRRQDAVDDERHVGGEHFDDLERTRLLGRHHIDIVARQLALAQPAVGFAERRLQRVGGLRGEIFGIGRLSHRPEEPREARFRRLVALCPRDQYRTRVDSRRLIHRLTPRPPAAELCVRPHLLSSGHNTGG